MYVDIDMQMLFVPRKNCDINRLTNVFANNKKNVNAVKSQAKFIKF